MNIFTEIPQKDDYGRQKNLAGNKWMEFFVRMRISFEKIKSKSGCEELVRSGIFSSILSDLYNTMGRPTFSLYYPSAFTINSHLLKDPEFVRNLKKPFAIAETSQKPSKESELWLPFEIVRNL